LFGTAAIGTLLLLRQWAFYTTATVVDDTVDIEVDVPRTYVQTGETIQVKASKAPAFKAGKALKDAVN
jgi:hypothetical protein